MNNSISTYKKSQRYVALDETLIEEAPEEISGVDLSECSDLRTSAVLSRMDELQESYRQILTLHYIEGFDYEEICEILQISYGNCRTMISRAKESLRKKLAIAS